MFHFVIAQVMMLLCLPCWLVQLLWMLPCYWWQQM